MKQYSIMTILVAAALTLTGCSDFLDEAPRGNAIATTTDDYDKMFNASQNFNLLMFDQFYAQWKSDDLIFTDGSIATITSATSFPTSVQAAIKYEDKIYRDDETTPETEQLYKQIYMYNSIANGVMDSDGDDAKKRQLLAEARVSRAYMHFILAQWFAMPYVEETAATTECLPIITEANTQETNFKKASIADYYQWILTEMEESCPQLEERSEHRMRCYKATGYALLGKVYFYMNKYDKAVEALRTAYSLLQGDANVYLTDHNTKQAATNYQELGAFSLLSYIQYPYRDNEVLFCKCSMGMLQYYPAYYGMEPADYLKPEVYALYTDNDLRRNTISTKTTANKAYTYPTATYRGAMQNHGITLPEVYLMLAESEARAGSQDNARKVLKEFRATRMLTGSEDVPADVTTKDDLVKFCIDEERREFAGTGQRFYNVRRLWNDPLFQSQKPITHTIGTTTYTMTEQNLMTPLPETILIFNEDMR